MVSRYMSLDDEHYIVKIDIPEKLNGINLYGIMQQAPQVKTLLVKRQQQILFETEETFTLQTHDILILEGHLQQLKKLSNCFI
ncbi:TrkA family potassium uptake protein, partial [Acinetobacter baumannii]